MDGRKGAAVMAGEYRDGSPRKVLFVIHHAVFGGPHNQALRLAGPLRERGYETIVLLPDMPGDAPERLRRAGIAVEQMPLHSLRARPDPILQARFALGFLPEVLAIRRRIRELGIDVVQVGGLVNPHAALAARAEGVPVVWQLLDTRAPSPVAWASMLWVRALATVVMPTGRKVLSAFPGWRRIASLVVPFVPPVDTDTFRPRPELCAEVRRQWGIADGVPVIGSVANINPQKGIAMLIEAFGRLRREIPEACLVLVGAEYATHRAYSRELRRRLGELGLDEGEAVRFMGAQSDIERQLQGFDLFALASVPRSEGIPTVLLEAMSCGLPVVATDVGGVTEVVEDGVTGYVVASLAAEAFGDAAAKILSDAERSDEMGLAGRERAVERFSVERCADIHAGAYERALGREALRDQKRSRRG
ncbi:MAG: glycosyltransferase [Chloroflexota bacterium]|nr:glycosyltransferase [Chloroflexota bacterium]